MKSLFLSLYFGVLILTIEANPVLSERLQSAQDSSIEGVDGWRFLPAEIRHLLAGDPSNDPKKPFEAIVDLNEQLKRLDIRLIVVAVPAKATIHPEFLDSRLKGQNAAAPESAFYESLRAKGVEVVDLTPDFLAAKANGPLYCARDSHWNGQAIALAAQKLAGMLKGVAPKTVAFDAKEESIEIQGDLGGEKEKVALRFVRPQGSEGRVDPDRSSPILVLGDSHVPRVSRWRRHAHRGCGTARSAHLRTRHTRRCSRRSRLGRDTRSRQPRAPSARQPGVSCEQKGDRLVFRSPRANSG